MIDALLLLYAYSAPGGYFLPMLVTAYGTPAIAVIWILRFVVAAARRDGRRGLRRHWLRWAAVPAAVTLTISLVGLNLPFRARFAVSKTDFARLAQTVQTGTDHERHGTTWVGLFPVTSVQRLGGGVLFRIEDTGFLDIHGIAWSPDGEPGPGEDGYDRISYRHLQGPWYTWVEPF